MSPPIAYFAYSTILDSGETESWMQKNGYASFRFPKGKVAEAAGWDIVYNFHSPRWGGRVAGLARTAGASVFGLLYEIPAADWPIVQHAEGGRGGKYTELTLELKVAGKAATAIAFTPRAELTSQQGLVSQQYVNTLARGAEVAGLPAEYVNKLKAEAMILERVQGFGQRMNLK